MMYKTLVPIFCYSKITVFSTDRCGIMHHGDLFDVEANGFVTRRRDGKRVGCFATYAECADAIIRTGRR